MTSIPHEPAGIRERNRLSMRLLVPEMWASLTIIVIWLAVLFDAVFGPDIVSTSGVPSVGTSTTVPSAVVLALFAFLATWVVARHGFAHGRDE